MNPLDLATRFRTRARQLADLGCRADRREPLPGHTLHTLALEIDALADRVEEIGGAHRDGGEGAVMTNPTTLHEVAARLRELADGAPVFRQELRVLAIKLERAQRDAEEMPVARVVRLNPALTVHMGGRR